MKTKNSQAGRAETPEAMVTHLRSLVTEAEKLMGEAPDEHRAEAIKSLRERFDAAHEKLSDWYAHAKERVVDGARSADEAIRAQPYPAVGIAAGSGLLLGLLLGRRCHRK
jgi:ElaB/YqjD/DUF883 family membrane-anchored ribosome-binding protein